MEVKATLQTLTDKQLSVQEVLDETLVALDIAGLRRLAAAIAKKRVLDKLMEGSAPLLQGEAVLTETIIKYRLATRIIFLHAQIDGNDVFLLLLWKSVVLIDDSSVILKASYEHDPACVTLTNSIDDIKLRVMDLLVTMSKKIISDNVAQFRIADDALRVFEACAILQHARYRCERMIYTLNSLGNTEGAEDMREVLKTLNGLLATTRTERTAWLYLWAFVVGLVLAAAMREMPWITMYFVVK